MDVNELIANLTAEERELLREVNDVGSRVWAEPPDERPKGARWLLLTVGTKGSSSWMLSDLSGFQRHRKALSQQGHKQPEKAAWKLLRVTLLRLARHGLLETEWRSHSLCSNKVLWVRLHQPHMAALRHAGVLPPTSSRGVSRALWPRLVVLAKKGSYTTDSPKGWRALERKGRVAVKALPNGRAVVTLTPAGRQWWAEIEPHLQQVWGG